MERTTKECQTIVFKLSVKFGVPPREIMDKLLSDDDKKDMMDGVIDVETLEAHMDVWVKNGKRDMVGRAIKTPAIPTPDNKGYMRRPFISHADYTKEKDERNTD